MPFCLDRCIIWALFWLILADGVLEVEIGVRARWVNAANRVGVAGARIYPDIHDPSLPSSLYFENVYPPDQMNTASSLIEFTRIIKDSKASIVYWHDDALYLIIDHTLGYVYYPRSDNFGR
jgi:hypothetical protein